MQIEVATIAGRSGSFKVTAYWLDQIADFKATVDYPVVIICPGGGFAYHSERETTPIVLRFLAAGMHAIVLPYQVITADKTVYPTAIQQIAETLNWITKQAEQHHVDCQRLIFAGFSAGGHVVATYNSIATNATLRGQYQLDHGQGQHAAIILGYPAIDLTVGFPNDAATRQQITPDETLWAAQKTVTSAAKPAFVWQTATDALVPAENSLWYVQALLRAGVPVEYHLFGDGKHGLALADHVTTHPTKPAYLNAPAAEWVTMALHWLQRQALLPKDESF
ncbi:esterase [Lactobacillus paraplantarum] [Lactiplantibacillus mudanjiangensis]|uniref:alpha/beta hydrolase n=1 Tax=Lactiplantibacillus mudanjiangensis TaxID=1296538 RepID=UPI001015AB02|nr:esterase [Lactobacillus paraplantarum] [Lactiplantibacillus mudanjiangensis]